MTTWKTLSTKILHETRWLRLVEDRVKTHRNKELTYTYVQTTHPGVAIVAVRENGDILIQKNYRYTLGETQWEIPAGHMEDDELPLAAAKRELLEEAGLASAQWIELGDTELASGVGNIRMHLFAARNVHKSNSSAVDEDEPISEQHFVSQHELRRMLRANEISSALSLIGMYRYLDTIEGTKE